MKHPKINEDKNESNYLKQILCERNNFNKVPGKLGKLKTQIPTKPV